MVCEWPTPAVAERGAAAQWVEERGKMWVEHGCRLEGWVAEGYTDILRTPDSTLIFVTPDRSRKIRRDQIECMGCLSACHFSNWSQNEAGTTGRKADPRSFCIQKTLQAVSHTSDIENELMFSGHNAYRFKSDPFYANGFIPTVRDLFDRIVSGQ